MVADACIAWLSGAIVSGCTARFRSDDWPLAESNSDIFTFCRCLASCAACASISFVLLPSMPSLDPSGSSILALPVSVLSSESAPPKISHRQPRNEMNNAGNTIRYFLRHCFCASVKGLRSTLLPRLKKSKFIGYRCQVVGFYILRDVKRLYMLNPVFRRIALANTVTGVAKNVERRQHEDGKCNSHHAKTLFMVESVTLVFEPHFHAALGDMHRFVQGMAHTLGNNFHFSHYDLDLVIYRFTVLISLFSRIVKPSIVNPLGLSSERDELSSLHTVTNVRSVTLLWRIINWRAYVLAM